MGQKINPIGFRLAVTRDWRSKWYASKKELAEYLLVDMRIRTHLKRKLKAGMFRRLESGFRCETDDAAIRHLGEGETRVSAANVDCYKLGRQCSSSRAAL